MESIWSIATILGPLLLAAGLIYGIYYGRRRRSLRPRNKAGTTYAQD